MKQCRRGFTLLEVITASAIMAVLALSLYTVLGIGLRARERVLAAVGPARSAEIAMDLVRRDLESALPPSGVLASAFLAQEGLEVPGTGGVQFYTVAPAPDPETLATSPVSFAGSSMTRAPVGVDPQDGTFYGGVQRVELFIRGSSATSGAGGDLVRRVARNLLSPFEPIADEEILCRGVTAFTLRYFDGLQWLLEWDSTQFGDTLPMAVEISLELTRPQDPTKPERVTTYQTTRVFFLPCRNETALTGGTE